MWKESTGPVLAISVLTSSHTRRSVFLVFVKRFAIRMSFG